MQSGDSASFADNWKSLLTLALNRTMHCTASCWNSGANWRHFHGLRALPKRITRKHRSPPLPPSRRSRRNPLTRLYPLNR
jgi:hypothetical protein